MASLIETLAGGIANAPSGTAEFYIQGTGTLQTVYSDNEGTVVVAAPHGLDANGAINRYVKGRTDVVVRTQGGAVAKTFTFGGDAREVRVENAGFTGTLAGGGTGPGGRTTVDAVLTSLFASLGAVDGKVLVNGAAVNISTALASSSGIFYSVKAYGATGAGVVDDTSSCQAATNAAIAAGGGVVYWPHGTYRISQVTAPAGSKVLFLGESEGGTIIRQHTGGINGWLLLGSDSTAISNITFARNATALSGRAVQAAGKLALYGCTFQGFAGTQLYAETATTTIDAYGCSFEQNEAGSRIATTAASGAKVRLTACSLSIGVASATSFDGTGGQVDLIGCTTALTAAATGGTVFSTGIVARVTGGKLDASAVGAGTTTVSLTGTLVIAGAQLLAGAGTLQLSNSGTLMEAGNDFASATVTLGAPSTLYSHRRHRGLLETSQASGSFAYAPSMIYRTHVVRWGTGGGGASTLTINAPTPSATGDEFTLVLFNEHATQALALTWDATYANSPDGGALSLLASVTTVNRYYAITFVRTGTKWVRVNQYTY